VAWVASAAAGTLSATPTPRATAAADIAFDGLYKAMPLHLLWAAPSPARPRASYRASVNGRLPPGNNLANRCRQDLFAKETPQAITLISKDRSGRNEFIVGEQNDSKMN
jgi:hypothetical protein